MEVSVKHTLLIIYSFREWVIFYIFLNESHMFYMYSSMLLSFYRKCRIKRKSRMLIFVVIARKDILCWKYLHLGCIEVLLKNLTIKNYISFIHNFHTNAFEYQLSLLFPNSSVRSLFCFLRWNYCSASWIIYWLYESYLSISDDIWCCIKVISSTEKFVSFIFLIVTLFSVWNTLFTISCLCQSNIRSKIGKMII